jgi:hypothetical protein
LSVSDTPILRVEEATYLCNTANVLITALLVKAKVLVETETDIVTIETVRGKTLLEKMLLESSGNSRLARGRETGEPDGSTLLLAELATLLAGKTSVPGDVAIAQFTSAVENLCLTRDQKTHVDIFEDVEIVVWRGKRSVAVATICKRFGGAVSMAGKQSPIIIA